MRRLDDLINSLPVNHRQALLWFASKSGSIQPWPSQLPGGILLASRAKGIYKPNWTKYALSIRQAIGGPYRDRERITRDDGTWSYLYFQENSDPAARDASYTNRGLLECHADNVPVGVMRQVKLKPNPRYEIFGVALVAGWEEGYFFLEGFSPNGVASENGPTAELDAFINQNPPPTFSPTSILDGRERIVASMVARRGQAEFRRKLLDAYQRRCTVTGCEVEEVLEAAHIFPYRGADTNQANNGLLLRADIHTLFDSGLIAIDSANWTVILSPKLLETSYASLSGQRLILPSDPLTTPRKDLVDYHRSWTRI